MPDATEAGVCPQDGHVDEEAIDYDVTGANVFRCGQCGIIYAQDKQGNTTLVNSQGF